MIGEFIYDPPAGLSVIFEDQDLLVIDKASGLLSVPGRLPEHHESAELRAKEHCGQALVLHRLDMDTSGIMVFAKKKKAQKFLARHFQERLVKKVYEARVAYRVDQNDGIVDLPLITDWPNRPLQKIDHTEGKPSLTIWRVLNREESSTRVELRPRTGRSHQLRVHMMAIGHPILGDRFYAPDDIIEAADRLNLHARSLTLTHPRTKEEMTFEAPLPF